LLDCDFEIYFISLMQYCSTRCPQYIQESKKGRNHCNKEVEIEMMIMMTTTTTTTTTMMMVCWWWWR